MPSERYIFAVTVLSVSVGMRVCVSSVPIFLGTLGGLVSVLTVQGRARSGQFYYFCIISRCLYLFARCILGSLRFTVLAVTRIGILS